MYHYKIELVTMNDILNFVNDVSKITGEVKLSDGKSFCINGKSLLGAIATVEWDSLYCVSEHEIYAVISKYCKD